MHTVGLIIVSHSRNLAKNVAEPTSTMAPDARIASAEGIDGGGFGTSFEKVWAVIESVYSDGGALILVNLGSVAMTTEMVIEMFEGKKVEVMDCPLAGDVVIATIDSVGGMSLEDIRTALAGVGRARKSQDIV